MSEPYPSPSDECEWCHHPYSDHAVTGECTVCDRCDDADDEEGLPW